MAHDDRLEIERLTSPVFVLRQLQADREPRHLRKSTDDTQ